MRQSLTSRIVAWQRDEHKIPKHIWGPKAGRTHLRSCWRIEVGQQCRQSRIRRGGCPQCRVSGPPKTASEGTGGAKLANAFATDLNKLAGGK